MNRKERRAKQKKTGRARGRSEMNAALSPELQALLDQALAHHQAGRARDAEPLYRHILMAVPEAVSVLNLLGVLCQQTGRGEEAVDLLRRAAALQPENPGLLTNLGEAERALGRLGEAVTHYREALIIDPRFVDAHYNLGLALLALGDAAGAADHLGEVSRLAPGATDVWLPLGNALRGAGDLVAAARAYRRAAETAPNDAAARVNLGGMLKALGRIDDAITAYRDAIAIDPTMAEAHANLGIVLEDRHRLDEAEAAFTRALELDPDSPRITTYLAGTVHQQGRADDALKLYARARELAPESFAARWGDALCLPIVYENEGDIDRWRRRWSDGVDAMAETLRLNTAAQIDDAFEAVLAGTNFLLHYQGRNDVEPQRRYGALVTRIVNARFPGYPTALPRRAVADGERIRVGLVSSFLYTHSIAKTHGRWITGLDAARFERFAFHLGATRDVVTERLAGGVDHFRHMPAFGDEVVAAIAAAELDVLIYADIGMDPIDQVLAALRLAPLQINGLGHPAPSGLDAIDVALSSDLMEPEDGDDHYTERLVRLPNLAACYELARIEAEFVDLEIRDAGAPARYLCSQSLYKLLPQFDGLYPRIAKRVGPCAFWFIAHHADHVTDVFRQRLRRAFAAEELDADEYCVIHERQDQKGFMALNRRADVLLDSCMWSGNNSSLEGIACGLPVVTWPGPFFRSRHTLGHLRMMDIADTLARDLDDYVEIAARLGTDADWRAAVTAKFAANRHRLYDDTAPIAALEKFIEDSVRG